MEGAHGDETQIKRPRRRRDHTERVLHGGESDDDTDIVEGKDEAIGSKRLCEREREMGRMAEAKCREKKKGMRVRA